MGNVGRQKDVQLLSLASLEADTDRVYWRSTFMKGREKKQDWAEEEVELQFRLGKA